MIQRIQSLLLLGAATLLGFCLFMPFWSANLAAGRLTLGAFSLSAQAAVFEQSSSTAYIGIGVILTLLLALYIILQFKNRTLQMRLCLLNAFLLIGLSGIIYWKAEAAAKLALLPNSSQFEIAFFFPSMAIVLHLMAMKYIKQDDELVRSADRIR